MTRDASKNYDLSILYEISNMEGEVRMSVYQEAYKLPEFKYEYERLKVDVRGPIHVVSFDDAAT